MTSISDRLQQVEQRIRHAERQYQRATGSVHLLAVSKTRPAADIQAALGCGQTRFGESYLQEALEKIELLKGKGVEWHFIGRIQSNKTKPIAANFDWVHSIDSIKQARRLSEQRPDNLAPLNVCLQVMLDPEATKRGCAVDQVEELAQAIVGLPRLRLRGLMTLPAPRPAFAEQRRPFRRLRLLQAKLQQEVPSLDSLSMGMSADLEAAIAEGATLVRVGTAIFGPRAPVNPTA